MSSAVTADSLEAALEAAIRRYDGTSPVTRQVHEYFGFAGRRAATDPRARMRLVLEVVGEEGGTFADGVDIACAVEMLHSSIRVHDTVEDPERSRFGLAHGINAGDALCAMAYLNVLEGAPRRVPEQTVEITRSLQAANFDLCAGQAQELALIAAGTSSDAAYLTMIGGKAALFAIACELGAFVAGAPCERARAYGVLGRTYGMAFQMEAHVQTDPAGRTLQLPPVATLATVQTYLAEADALATKHGIDASGRVRTYVTREMRQAA